MIVAPRNRGHGSMMLGWSISVTLHLFVLIYLAVLLFPRGGDKADELSLELSIVDEQVLQTVSMPSPAPALDVTAEVALKADLDEWLAKASPTIGDREGRESRSSGKLGNRNGKSNSTSFFGTTAYGDRFVYILDMSSSMATQRSSTTRFNLAIAECLKSIEKLGDHQSFYVVLFAYTTRRMFDEKSPIPMMVPATKENKEKLRTWLMSIKPNGGTDPREAMYLALKMGPSAVFLLSDGEFNGQQKKRRVPSLAGNPSVEDVVKEYNSTGSPIHTVAYEAPKAKQRMAALARVSKGEFDYVEPLPASRARGNPFASRIVAGKNKPRRSWRKPPAKTAERLKRDEKLAEEWYTKAQKAEGDGDVRAASMRYRALIARFPSSKYAQMSRQRLESADPGDLIGLPPLPGR